MKILITGSSGMLGRELCGVLSNGGREIVGVDIAKSKDGSLAPGAFHFADVSDRAAVKKIFEKEKPDMVIHTAAWTDVDGCENNPEKARKINVDGTANIVQAAGENSVPLIFISTDFVFDGKKRMSYTELDECGPLGVYARTKLDGEITVSGKLKDYAIVRTSWLFGDGGKNFVNTIISKASAEKMLKVVNDQTGSPTYTKDLAGAIKRLIETGIRGGEIYHICNSGKCSWYEFAVKIKSLAPGMENVDIEPVSSADIGRPAQRPIFSVMDTSKFQKRTGMALRSWLEALSEYLNQPRHPEEAAGRRRI